MSSSSGGSSSYQPARKSSSSGRSSQRMARRSSEKIIKESLISEEPLILSDENGEQRRLSNSWTQSDSFSGISEEYLNDVTDLLSLDEEGGGGRVVDLIKKVPEIQLCDQLTAQRWHEIGNSEHAMLCATSDFDLMVKQLSSVLNMRLRDLVLYWMVNNKKNENSNSRGSSSSPKDKGMRGRRTPGRGESSTTSCNNNSSAQSNNNNTNLSDYLQLDTQLNEYILIEPITQSLHEYVTSIGKLYNHVGFHSFEHATHVTLSMNKLLSMVPTMNNNRRSRSKRNLMSGGGGGRGSTIRFDDDPNTTTPNNHQHNHHHHHHHSPRTSTENFSYGIGEDPRILFAMVFSALIHDLGHTGVPNSVLVEEEDELAILHNDVSVAEQNSLQVAFSMLQKDEFATLKKCICPTPEERKFFRKKVICMVMVTDISDQERIQIVKSRWNAAFPPQSEGEEDDGGGGGGGNEGGEGSSSPSAAAARNVNQQQQDQSQQQQQRRPSRQLTKMGASQRGLVKNEIQSAELRETIRRRRFTMFTSDAAAQELAKERQARRLGIRTSMDFSGMLLDAYNTMDQLQQHAVLETMMNVADVAHTMQSFQVFVKWNKCLFKEFYVAHLSDRLAFNPSENWYENQIGFFSHYIIPLSQKMKTCGVFGSTGNVFEYFAMENKKRWIEDGEIISEEIIRDVMEEVERERQQQEEGLVGENGEEGELSNGCL